ncbi:MAG: glycosyl hydrolase [Bacteroidetes bacterium]|nr:MAG: glycosyl hydrolase [Bacteroidota bacterium]
MKNGFRFLILLLSFTMISCNFSGETEGKAEAVSHLPQTEDMLLSGVSEAVCYSGFRTGQHPDRGAGAVNPSYEEILEDLQILAEQTPFRLFRLYDCEENSQMVLEVIREHNLDFKVMLGIWLRAEIDSYETCEWLTEPWPVETLEQNKKLNDLEIAKGIELANKYQDIIVAVNVGNEALVDWNEHRVTVDSVITYVKRVQQAIEQPVTVADNYKWWADHGAELAEVVDFVSIHTYPIWEGRDIDEGMSYTLENVEEVMNALPGKQIVIAEAGWATIASEFGPRASQEKQKQYVGELMEWSKQNNITTFIFEAFDEDWKGDPTDPMGAEKHWGLYTVDREPKKAIDIFTQDYSN